MLLKLTAKHDKYNEFKSCSHKCKNISMVLKALCLVGYKVCCSGRLWLPSIVHIECEITIAWAFFNTFKAVNGSLCMEHSFHNETRSRPLPTVPAMCERWTSLMSLERGSGGRTSPRNEDANRIFCIQCVSSSLNGHAICMHLPPHSTYK